MCWFESDLGDHYSLCGATNQCQSGLECLLRYGETERHCIIPDQDLQGHQEKCNEYEQSI